MNFPLCFVFIASLQAVWNSANAACETFPSVKEVSEVLPNDTLLLNITKLNSDTVTFDIKNETGIPYGQHAALKTFFVLHNNDTFFTLTTNLTLDLEFLSSIFDGKDLSNIFLQFKCGAVHDVTLIVTPVNEFTPILRGAPYNITIRESMTKGSVVKALRPLAGDGDIPPPNNFFFNLHPYNIIPLDGMSHFKIPITTNGELILDVPIDFDSMPSKDRPYYTLNISVADANTGIIHTYYTTMTITIEDVDDQRPYFNFPQCAAPCTAPPYEAITTLDQTGLLTVEPSPIEAKDDDTLHTPLVYSIMSGNEHGLFSIDPTNGNITQITSVTSTGLPDKEFRLVIKVRKNLTNVDLSSIAILTIGVFERMPFMNVTDIPEQPAASKEGPDSNGLLIPVVVLGVILVIIIVISVVVVLLIRRKQKQMMVQPDDNKSEPQTEEEEIHTDRSDEFRTQNDSNERLVFNGKATLGIGTDPFPPTPDTKPGQLPPLPLKDSATETMEGDGRKKKRMRRRNKNKEPEIFDGTREYNMGMEPEFFDSTDKSKVKRSQRSYDKKSDPALWIKVPNDQPVDTHN